MSVIENGSESEFGRDTLLDRAVHMTFKVAAIGIVFLIVAGAPPGAFPALGGRLALGAAGAGSFRHRGVASIRR